MFNDVEADYWKEILVHIIHKNMIKTDTERLTLTNCGEEVEKFNQLFPQYENHLNDSSSSKTWEAYITPTIKFRLFIQNQVKVSIMQKQGKDFIKVADGKFPYNPFPEIIEFYKNRDFYLSELLEKKEETEKSTKQLKLVEEMIKALLIKKYANTQFTWNMEQKGEGFELNVRNNDSVQTVTLTIDDFVEKIKEL